MKDVIDMLLEVTANRPGEEAESVAPLGADCERALSPALDELRTGNALAEALALPASMPVRFRVRVLPRVNGDLNGGRIPLKANVVALPPLLTKMRPAVQDELGDQLFRALRRVEVPADVATALGFEGTTPVRFELELQEEKPQVDSVPVPVSQGCVPGSQFSWSKGCSSWPW